MSSPGDNGEKKEGDNGENKSTPPPKVEISDYVVVQDEDGGEPMELPVNKEDNSLGMSTLTSAFPGSHGLKFKNPKTGASRALMMDSSGTKFLAPPDGWENKTFTVIFPPSRGAGEAKRRKFGDGSDTEEDEGAAKQKRLDDKPTDLICLGVNYTTTGETFKKHFEQFGEVVSADLKLNYEGKSKGFGFVLMNTLEEQDNVLNQDKHEIDGRRVEVKIPDSRSENFRNPLLPREQSTNKVFVGRLPETTTDELRAFFEAEAKKLNPHANITDCFLPRPFRGFGFVTFSTCEMARKICVANNFSMKGSPLAVSLAVPRDDPAGGPSPVGGRGGGPMRGADRYPTLSPQYGGGSMSSGYGYGYGGGEFGRGYDDWQPAPRYVGSWEGQNKSPNSRPLGGTRAGPPPAHLTATYGTLSQGPPSHGGGGGHGYGGPSTPQPNYGSPGGGTPGYGGGPGTPSSNYGGGPGTPGGGNYGSGLNQSLSMALAGNIPGMGVRGGRMNGGGGHQPLNAQPASLATGLDALNLNRNNNPEVFSAAWAVFMNTLKNGQNQGPPPNQQHQNKW
ncbi:tdp-1 [Pristionchus pacificus]|nr:tdp-1 [Pristionchus pacificus]